MDIRIIPITQRNHFSPMIQNIKTTIRIRSYPVLLFAMFITLNGFSVKGDNHGQEQVPDNNQINSGTPGQTDNNFLSISVEDALLLALENNRTLKMQRFTPEISMTFEEQERAAFDVALSAQGKYAEREPASFSNPEKSTVYGAESSLQKLFPIGAKLGLEFSFEDTQVGGVDTNTVRVGLTFQQALLRGRGRSVNLASLSQARLASEMSWHEFRGYAEALSAEVETTYLNFVIAFKQNEIVQQWLHLAECQLTEIKHRIRVGQLAETELAAAEAEIASRNEALINSEGRIETLCARLNRLLIPTMLVGERKEILPLTEPVIQPMPLGSKEEHTIIALLLRADIAHAELLLETGEIELVKTKNGLLPKMDLFVNMGKTGYADSFSRAFSDLDGDGYDVSAGLMFEYPHRNRRAKAVHSRSKLTLAQREEALENMKDLVRLDVELAFIEMLQARKQVDATKVTRSFQEEKLRAETAKFKVGKSTAILVAGAQRDLLSSQVAEAESLVKYLIARINLYKAEGSLLARRGICVLD
ncbi:MAG: TolC family protein [Lentisphaerae bacterium]|nr:TolC family protein [Lentisphaerota bacterium]